MVGRNVRRGSRAAGRRSGVSRRRSATAAFTEEDKRIADEQLERAVADKKQSKQEELASLEARIAASSCKGCTRKKVQNRINRLKREIG